MRHTVQHSDKNKPRSLISAEPENEAANRNLIII